MRDALMRTTLSIDDDVLAAAKELAASGNKSVGDVISSLARNALHRASSRRCTRNGVPLLVVRPGTSRFTSELGRKLQDELE